MVWNKRRLLVLSLLMVTSVLSLSIVSGHIAISVSLIKSIDVSPPPGGPLNLISFTPVAIQGKVVGSIAIYDDWTTGKPREYTEICTEAGELVGVIWHDRFGIQRRAVDRGILLHREKLDGTLVLLLSGHFI